MGHDVMVKVGISIMTEVKKTILIRRKSRHFFIYFIFIIVEASRMVEKRKNKKKHTIPWVDYDSLY